MVSNINDLQLRFKFQRNISVYCSMQERKYINVFDNENKEKHLLVQWTFEK